MHHEVKREEKYRKQARNELSTSLVQRELSRNAGSFRKRRTFETVPEQDELPNQAKFHSITVLDGQARSANARLVSGPHTLLSPGMVPLSVRQPGVTQRGANVLVQVLQFK